MSTTATSEELGDLSLCAQKLWDLDNNRIQPEVDYAIAIQEGTSRGTFSDAADNRLFLRVNDDVWKKPTYNGFRALLDNYERETGVRETATRRDRNETNRFLDLILATQPMEYVRNYLVATNRVENEDAFRERLQQMWFDYYERDAGGDSSGFEHVFVGESDGDRVSGFHNWIQYYVEESRGAVDYRGYIASEYRSNPPNAFERVLILQLAWNGELKRITSIFLGTSPEFELALYTLYFLAGQQRNRVRLLDYTLEIVCYTIHDNQVGSCFPDIVADS